MVPSISPQPPNDTSPAGLAPEREQEIRSREQAATPGPWESDGAEIYGTLGGVLMIDLWVGETLDVDNQERSNADAAFIASARSAVPDLLAEVDRLRARVAELEAQQATVLALHRKHNDSDHCFADDEAWPCNTRSALAPATTPRDLRPGADAARRMIRDRQEGQS